MEPILPLLARANWPPALIGLIGIPVLYTILAVQTHRDYAELVKDAREAGLSPKQMARLIAYIEDRIQVFQLKWWVVAAFGILLFAIMGSGAIPGLERPPVSAEVAETACSGLFNECPVRSGMAAYGTLFGLAVGYRLIWARLMLAKDIKNYYACDFRPGLK